MTENATRESSMLIGGPRDRWAYWTDELDASVGKQHARTDGYRRTDEFVDNDKAPTKTSRVWRWTR